MTDAPWFAVRVRPRGGDDAYEATLAALFDAGSPGVQEDGPTIVTQFPPDTPIDDVRRALEAADPSADIVIGPAETIDWTEGWKTHVKAHELGALAVVPPWLADGRGPRAYDRHRSRDGVRHRRSSDDARHAAADAARRARR